MPDSRVPLTFAQIMALGDDAFVAAWYDVGDLGRHGWQPRDRAQAFDRYCWLRPYTGAPKVKAAGTSAIPHLDDFVDGAEFISHIPPPQWLIDGIVQRGYLYGLTALTNHGKTALAALMAISVALGREFAGQECEPGHVLYMSGENPDDFRARLRGACQAADIPWKAIAGRITVLPVVDKLIDFNDAIKVYTEDIPLALVLIDTSAAYFSYADENANVDHRLHAQDMRLIIYRNGAPAVVALCHPVKNAARDNLIPRGGGAFLNELDCNLTLWKEGEVCELSHNKLRGPSFQPMQFKLTPCVLNGINDTKGRDVTTVVMRPMSDTDAASEQDRAYSDLEQGLMAISKLPKPTLAAIATYCSWGYKDGRPDKSRAQRVVSALIADKLAVKHMGRLKLTTKGRASI